MDSIGKILYEARAAKGLTLLDAEKATSIRCSYLDALEQDDYSKLPEEVFIKGIIRNYGNYLGLNGPELVDMYKAAKAGTGVENVKSQGIREVDTVKLNISLKQHRSVGSGVSAYQGPTPKKNLAKQIFAGALGVVVLVSGYFLMPKAMEWLHKDDAADAPVVAVVPSPAETQKVEAVAPVVEKVMVEMIAHGDCWLEVNADGKSVYEGMLRAKDVKTFDANEKLIVKYGNVGVMEVKVNGQPVSMQGEQGVAIKTYTK
ncbi:MAG: helix-turn-helix domain-containing protein [Phascolarctobacterium sp.]|nr:helix-turn-helix domain-containing protein [Phascolarctobacterium sp.]